MGTNAIREENQEQQKRQDEEMKGSPENESNADMESKKRHDVQQGPGEDCASLSGSAGERGSRGGYSADCSSSDCSYD